MGHKRLVNRPRWIMYADWGWPLWILPHLDVERGAATWGVTVGWVALCLTVQWQRFDDRARIRMGDLPSPPVEAEGGDE